MGEGGEKRHAGPGLHEDTHSSPWPGTLHLGTIVIRTSKNFIVCIFPTNFFLPLQYSYTKRAIFVRLHIFAVFLFNCHLYSRIMIVSCDTGVLLLRHGKFLAISDLK